MLLVQLCTDAKTFKLLGKEHALVIPNHRHDVDWLVVWIIAQRFGCLGSAPVISKDSSKFVPVLGWATWFSDFVFLKRDWNKDQGTLKSSLQALKDFPSPFWLILFVEGTRLTRKKLQAAQEFARSAGVPIPKNVLVPRTKGFVSTVKYVRPFVPAVYDVTLAVPKNEPPPSLVGIFWKKPSLVKVHIKRYAMEELPESDEGISEWCKDRYVAKDAFLDKFLATGTYGDEKYHEIRPIKSLCVALFWICASILSIYELCQKYSPLSSWKGIGISAGTLGSVLVVMYAILLSAHSEQSKEEKEAASNKS